MMTIALDQEKVNELVDRFYDKLLKDSYYINMFNHFPRLQILIKRSGSGKSC
ncbi:hypothetical protein [Bacillus sp. ISL-46]|uniref:hypothetical protein n=1 Tax=Bacillus sp. ISL-46 TaxID=2819129 RepID=UPI001BE79CD7|nr:hypothetical protein [Bacillus sp. ISL-46]MBT2724472.1 hypothetical protein [Bacillus sp. ISL-46]